MPKPRRFIPHVLGRRELIDLPALALLGVEAKVDTGAYTSAIHCEGAHLTTDPATGQPLLHVRLLDPGHPTTDGRELVFSEFAQRDIRSSNGEVQARYVIRTTVRLFGQDYSTEFSLADRSDLRYPVLLGRALLRQGRFLVDVTQRDRSRRVARKSAHYRPPNGGGPAAAP